MKRPAKVCEFCSAALRQTELRFRMVCGSCKREFFKERVAAHSVKYEDRCVKCGTVLVVAVDRIGRANYCAEHKRARAFKPVERPEVLTESVNVLHGPDFSDD